MLPNKVKLVVWDLDETFWHGTLAEGEITPVAANIGIVKTLCQRGIMSSISSKNDFAKAHARLIELGIWDYFIFPKIEFSPKGGLVAGLIEEANLRAENVLFIDDLHMNREEVRHFCSGIMVADPVDILGQLLDLPQLTGKDDAALSRLIQYKNLEQKSISRSESKLSNEDFLRGCDIRVDIRHDLDGEFDRIVELANRTNQLNFTKLRLETPKAIAEFKELCSAYGTSAGTIHVSDRYGDYGMVGYYVMRSFKDVKELLHFVFSCRTMNMGIEQYVYERLREPSCKIVAPVANAIKTFSKIDWIREGAGGEVSLGALEGDKKLVLIGGCELRQLASLCSTNRAEYVNEVENNNNIRHDDFGFILSDRKIIKKDQKFAKTFTWKAATALAFDRDVESSSIVIASLFRALDLDYFKTRKSTWFGLGGTTLEPHLRRLGVRFVRSFWFMPMDRKERMQKLRESLDRIAAIAPPGAALFALGVSTWSKPKPGNRRAGVRSTAAVDPFLDSRRKFNKFVRDYCKANSRYFFVDLDDILRPEDIISPTHFHRQGYLAIAKFISAKIAERSRPATIKPLRELRDVETTRTRRIAATA